MIQKVTNKKLMELNLALRQMEIAMSPLYVLNRTKFREFYNKNGVRIKSMLERREFLLKSFCVFEDGKIVFEGEADQRKVKLHHEEERPEFEKAITDFDKELIDIDF